MMNFPRYAPIYFEEGINVCEMRWIRLGRFDDKAAGGRLRYATVLPRGFWSKSKLCLRWAGQAPNAGCGSRRNKYHHARTSGHSGQERCPHLSFRHTRPPNFDLLVGLPWPASRHTVARLMQRRCSRARQPTRTDTARPGSWMSVKSCQAREGMPPRPSHLHRVESSRHCETARRKWFVSPRQVRALNSDSTKVSVSAARTADLCRVGAKQSARPGQDDLT